MAGEAVAGTGSYRVTAPTAVSMSWSLEWEM